MPAIRKATNKDIEKIYHWFYNPVVFFLCDPILQYPFRLSEWLKLFSKRDLYVSESENIIVGSIAVKQNEENQEISHLYVTKSRRNLGFAKALIQYVSGKSEITTIKLLENQREQIKLFTDLGFRNTNKTEYYKFENLPEKFDLYRKSQ